MFAFPWLSKSPRAIDTAFQLRAFHGTDEKEFCCPGIRIGVLMFLLAMWLCVVKLLGKGGYRPILLKNSESDRQQDFGR